MCTVHMCVVNCPEICLDCFLHTQPGYTTPLHQAAEKGHYDVVAVLLLYNADGTMTDRV